MSLIENFNLRFMVKSFVVGDEYEFELDEATAMSAVTDSVGEPQTYQDALSRPDAESWRKAMDAEYEPLCDNEVFEIVSLPEGRSVVDCKWVYKIKRDAEGHV